ncbi:MAG: hypothetical protein ACK2UK_04720 [Candidatus Promineifilaceae bacterium]
MRINKRVTLRPNVERFVRLIIQILPFRGNPRYLTSHDRRDQYALIFFGVTLLSISLACNAFAGSSQPFPDPPSLTQSPPSITLTPMMAATATISGDDSATTVTTLVDLNIRQGPGVQYARIGFLPAGITAPVLGLEPQSGWWKIRCPEDVSGDACWVSGGARYVTVTRRGAVPTIPPPVTPIPESADAQTENGLIAYLDNGQLLLADLEDVDSYPAEIANAKQISEDEIVEQFAFSPDGRRLAYVAQHELGSALYLYSFDTDEDYLLTTSAELLAVSAGQTESPTILIDKIQWLPDSNTLVFNTTTILSTGSLLSNEDLWTVEAGGELKQRLAAGEGGGRFLVESTGQVLVSRTMEIARVTLKDNTQEVILRFTPVNTAREIPYYPEPQRTEDGLYVAIPAADPWSSGAVTTLYALPATGGAVETGIVANVSLDQLPRWSATGQQLAFVQLPDSQEQTAQLVIAGNDGSSAVPYAGGPVLHFLSWKPQEDIFLYSGKTFYALGRLHDPPKQSALPAGTSSGEAHWMTKDSFLLTVDDVAAQRWELRHVNQAGDMTVVASGQGQDSAFELWLPG